MLTSVEIFYHSNPYGNTVPPATYEDELGFKHSDTKIIYCKDGTIWMAFWDDDEHVWKNANSPDKFYLNEDYVVGYLDIPKRKNINYYKPEQDDAFYKDAYKPKE